MNLEQLDRAEDKRVERMARAAKRRPHLYVSQDKSSSRGRHKKMTFSLNMNARTLGLTEAGAVQLIQKKAEARVRAAEYVREHPPVIHVKNGKPLTEHGAKLLGVPWTPGA